MRFKGLELGLVFSIILLVFLGLLNLYSATFGEKGIFFYKQVIWIVLGGIACTIVVFYDYHRIVERSSYFYVLGLALLALVLFAGKGAGGARRWLSMLGFSLQPSEIMKPIMIVLFSKVLSARGSIDRWGGVIELFFYAALPTLLIAKEPDLGTSAVIFSFFFFYLFLSVSRLKFFFTPLMLSLGALPVMWSFLRDYQKRRLLVFLNPSYDPLGAGYNLVQSKISLGSGGVFGAGFLKGLQHRLRFLPEHHTDFIFCVWGEEFGFIGTSFLLLIYLFVIWRLYQIALLSKDREGFYICAGVAYLFFVHVFVNVGMTLGLTPVKGLPLPFFSYGGSSSLAMMICIGLALSVYRYRFSKEDLV
ncbi:MAG: rod shape-determining protein RodA [Synergistetes bacterium]|nr:rod shape-determining protein RodA [Synergistota bacterium]